MQLPSRSALPADVLAVERYNTLLLPLILYNSPPLLYELEGERHRQSGPQHPLEDSGLLEADDHLLEAKDHLLGVEGHLLEAEDRLLEPENSSEEEEFLHKRCMQCLLTYLPFS